MQNITLVQGRCSVCNGPIDKEWAGENPTIGTSCRDHFSEGHKIFGLDHVDLKVATQVVYDPLFGKYEYHFDFKGTKIKVNGEVGEIRQTYLGSSTVKFPGGSDWGTSVSNIDYWRLKDLYEQSGGQMTPPELSLPDHKPVKIKLLDKPICPVIIEQEDGIVTGVEVGNWESGYPNFPMYRTLHAFCNMFVRWKFGLSPNFVAEGGFIGADFEIRNHMMGSGLSVRSRSARDDLRGVTDLEDIKTVLMGHVLKNMLYQQEQSRSDVALKQADAWNVVTVWAQIMETLLRYDWRNEPYETIEDVWRAYCTMQDVLMNLFDSEQALTQSLAYARDNEIRHAGSPF